MFGDKDEEEEKPKEQEFTVVLQEGDKLELTDIEKQEETEEGSEDGNNGEDDEKEAELVKDTLMICPSCDETVPEYSSCMACGQQFESEYEEEPEIEYYDHVQLQESDGKLIMSLNRTVTSHFFEGDAGDLLEDIRANSNWEWLTADQLGALSEADVLARGSYSDDGEFEPAENVVYAYTDYQVSDWFNSLKENGIVVFEGFPVEKGAFYQDAKVKEAESNQDIKWGDVKEMDNSKCPFCFRSAFRLIDEEGEKFSVYEEDIAGDNWLLECAKCKAEWNQDGENTLDGGYTGNAEYEAVSAKVTRPVKEEEKEEEGMSTLMKVGLGVGALAVGAAILGAESPWDESENLKPDYDWTQIEDHFNPEEGEICGYECGHASIVGYGDRSYCQEHYREMWAESFEAEGESDYWAGENAHWRAEGSGEDLTSSEFVPFDQITAEIQEEWDETTIPVAADYEPSNQPTNENFSAEFEAGKHSGRRSRRKKQGLGTLAPSRRKKQTNEWRPFNNRIKSRKEQQQDLEDYKKHGGAENFSADEEEIFRHKQQIIAKMMRDAPACESCGNLKTYTPTEYNKYTCWSCKDDPSWGAETIKRGGERCSVCGDLAVHVLKKGEIVLCDKHYQQRFGRYSAEDSPSPSGPSEEPEPAEATGSEPSNENFEADSNNMNWIIGLTALGVGVAALGYSDKILALFDRFKK